eukprot:4662149-Amphidinium_carterae.2
MAESVLRPWIAQHGRVLADDDAIVHIMLAHHGPEALPTGFRRIDHSDADQAARNTTLFAAIAAYLSPGAAATAIKKTKTASSFHGEDAKYRLNMIAAHTWALNLDNRAARHAWSEHLNSGASICLDDLEVTRGRWKDAYPELKAWQFGAVVFVLYSQSCTLHP